MGKRVITNDKKCFQTGQTITAEDVDRAMKKINASKKTALDFLKRIGVSFTKTGRVRVRPI